jgi:Effector Associated Constant Component 1
MEPTEIGIAVEPEAKATTPQAVTRLERWLTAQPDLAKLELRRERRADADAAMGVIDDLVAHFPPDAVEFLVGVFVRSVISHLRTQRPDDLTIVIHYGEERLELRGEGMDRGRLEQLELKIRQWLHRGE